MAEETKLELRSITHRFADADGPSSSSGGVLALDDISLDVGAGRFVCLLGPSGCGKSTIFNIAAGLLRPTAGSVRIDGEDVTGSIGTVGYMLQKDLLLPWRTVLDNVILGLELKGVPRRVARDRALPLLARYGLGGFEHRYPQALSGGMRQRAALLRTLLYDTEIVLLDEPFGALDAQTRSRMQEWLLTLWNDFHKTVIFVTHDVEEAVYLSDEIVVMTPRPGRVKARLAVDLPRPRARNIVSDPAFGRLRQQCVELLQDGDAAPRGASAAA
jgi:ABC-type nitrate/sulfonate/bicarbonate transport system ATPase subunit